jgi:hypothetical protein
MKLKSITAKEAERLMNKLGLCVPDDYKKTFYATDIEETEVWDFDTKKERDDYVENSQ